MLGSRIRIEGCLCVDHVGTEDTGYVVKLSRMKRIVGSHSLPIFRRAELAGIADTAGASKSRARSLLRMAQDSQLGALSNGNNRLGHDSASVLATGNVNEISLCS